MESKITAQEVTFVYDEHGEKIEDDKGRFLVKLATGKMVYVKPVPISKPGPSSTESTKPDDTTKHTKVKLKPKSSPKTTKHHVTKNPSTKPRLPWNDDLDRIITSTVSEMVKGSEETDDTATGKKSFKQGAKVWTRIATKVNAEGEGYDFTPEQCRGRYNTIVAAFRRIEEEKNKAGRSRVRASTSKDVLEIVRNIAVPKEDDPLEHIIHKSAPAKAKSKTSINKPVQREQNSTPISSRSDEKSVKISCMASSTLAKEVQQLREQHTDMHIEKMIKLDKLIEENKRTNEERKRTNELLAEHNQLLYQLLSMYQPSSK